MFTDHPQQDFTMPRTTEGIRALTQINGLSIVEIERRMKTQHARYSSSGFLGKQESLLDVLAQDNDTVLRLGLTHEQIADDINKLFLSLDYPPPHSMTQGRSRTEYNEFMSNLKKRQAKENWYN